MTAKGKTSNIELSDKVDRENKRHEIINSKGMQTISFNTRTVNTRKATAKIDSTFLKENSLMEENERHIDSISPKSPNREKDKSARKSLLNQSTVGAGRNSIFKRNTRASVFEVSTPARVNKENSEKRKSSAANFENFRKEFRERASMISKKSINNENQSIVDSLISEEQKKRKLKLSDEEILESFHKKIE